MTEPTTEKQVIIFDPYGELKKIADEIEHWEEDKNA